MQMAEVEALIVEAGLTPRGAFHPVPADGVPAADDEAAVGTLVLAGNAGPAMWQRFCAERDHTRELLDDWSRETLERIAMQAGARALFPFARPYLPFQKWAQRAESVHVSPLGVLIHPRYGLWHGYRGALAFEERLDLPEQDAHQSPCLTCKDKPCLSTCPVQAFSGTGYDVAACAGHLSAIGDRKVRQENCLTDGCLARHACPVGRAYAYEPAQAEFHMVAFLSER